MTPGCCRWRSRWRFIWSACRCAESGVWCGILRSAFPDRRVRFWATAWAYLIGVGANAVAPFRGGDIVRIYATRRELGKVSVTTIVSTMVAESVFGAVVVAGMFAAIVGLGWIPPVVSLHDAGAFEFSFYADHAYAVLAVGLLLVPAGVLLVKMAGSHLQLFRVHIAQGVRILGPLRAVRAGGCGATDRRLDLARGCGVLHARRVRNHGSAAIRVARRGDRLGVDRAAVHPGGRRCAAGSARISRSAARRLRARSWRSR